MLTTDGGPAAIMSFGVAGATFTSADQSGAAAAVTDVPTTGSKLVVTDIEVSVSVACIVTFSEETSGTVVAKLYMPATSFAQITPRGKRKLATANKRLMVRTDVASAIAVTAHYCSEV